MLLYRLMQGLGSGPVGKWVPRSLKLKKNPKPPKPKAFVTAQEAVDKLHVHSGEKTVHCANCGIRGESSP